MPLQPGNLPAQPVPQCVLKLQFGSTFIEGADRLSLRGQWNAPAGKARPLSILRNILNQKTFGAGLRLMLAIEVDAGGGVLKDEVGPPGESLGMTITALLQEGQFGLQDIKEVSTVLYGIPPQCTYRMGPDQGP